MLVLVGWRRVERHIARTRRRCATRSQQVLKMPRTKDIPRRCEGDDLAVREQQRAAAALAAVPAPAPHRDALQAGGVGASEVTVKEEEVEEEEEEEEKTPEEPRRDRLGLALGPAGMLASGPRATLVSAPVPAHQDHAPPTAGAGASGVTLVVKEETEQEETLAQLRDRLRLCARVPAPGPLAALVLIKVEDSTSGEDTDGGEGDLGWGEGEGEEEEGEEEIEEEEGGEGEGVGERQEHGVYGGGQTGRGTRKRAEGTATIALPAQLLQLAAPAPPPPLPSPSPQHVDVKWVEGQGERCTRCGGSRGWRCSSAAVPGRTRCAHHAAKARAEKAKARLNQTGSLLLAPVEEDEGGVGAGGGGGGGGGGRRLTSKFCGVFALTGGGTGRWKTTFKRNGKSTNIGTFDIEEDAARAWDRMMVWCHLHEVVLKRRGANGLHTSDTIKAALNFAYESYASEMNELRSIATQDAMAQKLRQAGRAQPGCSKRKRA